MIKRSTRAIFRNIDISSLIQQKENMEILKDQWLFEGEEETEEEEDTDSDKEEDTDEEEEEIAS